MEQVALLPYAWRKIPGKKVLRDASVFRELNSVIPNPFNRSIEIHTYVGHL